jgi:hypothetical protein
MSYNAEHVLFFYVHSIHTTYLLQIPKRELPIKKKQMNSLPNPVVSIIYI